MPIYCRFGHIHINVSLGFDNDHNISRQLNCYSGMTVHVQSMALPHAIAYYYTILLLYNIMAWKYTVVSLSHIITLVTVMMEFVKVETLIWAGQKQI